jgi:[acyl-carrier-protein] S-malonyltransferase
MEKFAFVFPGQGSQYVGMGKDLWERNGAAREFFERADRLLKYNLSEVCFEGPEEKLRQTKNTQPAIFLHSLALSNLLKDERAFAAAGHSLGEYTALVYAGAMTFEDGLQLVRLRAELMQKACDERPGTMAAIIGLDSKVIGEVCQIAGKDGIVQAANYNSPGQVVISGSVSGVRKAMEVAKERGARMVKELVVSGAFHSPLMESAAEQLKDAIERTPVREARMPVYANVTGAPIRKPDDIRAALAQQLTSAVQWEESIRNMIADGVSKFIEVGPGKVLQGLIKRIGSEVEVKGIERLEDLALIENTTN